MPYLLNVDRSNIAEWTNVHSASQLQATEPMWFDLATGERLPIDKAKIFANLHVTLSNAYLGVYSFDETLSEINKAQVGVVHALAQVLAYCGISNITWDVDAPFINWANPSVANSYLIPEGVSDVEYLFVKAHGVISDLTSVEFKDLVPHDVLASTILVLIRLFDLLADKIQHLIIMSEAELEAFPNLSLDEILIQKTALIRQAVHRIA